MKGVSRELLLAAVIAVMPAAVVAVGCDDTNQRRTEAIFQVRGGDEAAADRGAATLEAMLAKNPRDRLALSALGDFYRRRGRTDEAKMLYERLLSTSPGSEEADRARESLGVMAAAATASAEARAPKTQPAPTASLAPTAIVPGKGIEGLSLGAKRADVEKRLGPCQLVTTGDKETVCHYFARGIEVAFAIDKADKADKDRAEKVVRVSVYREGREHVASTQVRTPYRGFVGAMGSASAAVSVGLPIADVEAALGPPTGKRLPVAPVIARDESLTVEVWDYAKKGYALEIDLASRGGKHVSGIHIPTVEGRPADAPTTGKP